MKEYEILIETINPCGGESHAKKEIIEAECCPDHIHMLVKIPPKYSIAEIVGYLKGKSALMIFDRHANLKYRYGNRHF